MEQLYSTDPLSTRLTINRVIENHDPPAHWKEALTSLDNTRLIQEYDSSLMWLSESRIRQDGSIDVVDLTAEEEDRLKDVLHTLQSEVRKRVDKYITSKSITYHDMLGKVAAKITSSSTLTGEPDIGISTSPREVTDYFIFQNIIKEERSQAGLSVKPKNKSSQNIGSLAAGAASTLLIAACVFTFPSRPPENSYPTETATELFTTTPTISPTPESRDFLHLKEHPTHTPTPTPTELPVSPTPEPLTFVKAETYLAATATALPPWERETLENGVEFYKSDIREIKSSSYIIVIESSRGAAGCSTTVVEKEDDKIVLLTARHCFGVAMNSDLFIGAYSKLYIINPETGMAVNVLVEPNGLIYNPGQEQQDVLFIVGTLDNPKFEAKRLGMDRLVADYSSDAPRHILSVGYPAVLQQPDPEDTVFLAGEGAFLEFQHNVVVHSSGEHLPDNVYKTSLVHQTPVSPGASGGSGLIKVRDGHGYVTKIIGVNSYTSHAVYSADGRLLDPIRAGIATIPQDLLERAREVFK